MSIQLFNKFGDGVRTAVTGVELMVLKVSLSVCTKLQYCRGPLLVGKPLRFEYGRLC